MGKGLEATRAVNIHSLFPSLTLPGKKKQNGPVLGISRSSLSLQELPTHPPKSRQPKDIKVEIKGLDTPLLRSMGFARPILILSGLCNAFTSVHNPNIIGLQCPLHFHFTEKMMGKPGVSKILNFPPSFTEPHSDLGQHLLMASPSHMHKTTCVQGGCCWIHRHPRYNHQTCVA